MIELAKLIYGGHHSKQASLFQGDCLEVLKSIDLNTLDSLVTDPPAGIAFMGKDWDKDKGGRDAWIAWMVEVMGECLRVLKPGAYGLVWALPRTSHWTATALEDAGFEIRDVVTHLFGTGFPKSHNLGDGFGTALKPASEHWILVRKPISEKTVTENVLKWGTGGINIDGCRINYRSLNDLETTKRGVQAMRDSKRDQKQSEGWDRPWQEKTPRIDTSNVKSQGRFPANLVLDEEAARLLDEQVGHLVGAGNKPGSAKKAGTAFGTKQSQVNIQYDKGGSASRFFYVAKATKTDRGDGNKHPTVKSTKLMSYLIRLVTPPGGIILDPFMGSGSTGASASGFKFVGIEKELEYFNTAVKRIT